MSAEVRDRWHHDPEKPQSDIKATAEKTIQDHAMEAEFGRSRAVRQSSRTGCKDEHHDQRVAAALARQVARENPMLMVQQVGASVQVQQMDGYVPDRRNRPDLGQSSYRRREEEIRFQEEEREAARRKKKTDEEAADRKAKAIEQKKRQDAGLAERRKGDEERALKRRERLGLPSTATAEECIKREKRMKKRDSEAAIKGVPIEEMPLPWEKKAAKLKAMEESAAQASDRENEAKPSDDPKQLKKKADAALQALLGAVPKPAPVKKSMENAHGTEEDMFAERYDPKKRRKFSE